MPFLLLLGACGLRRHQTQPKLRSENPVVLDMLGMSASATESDVNWLIPWDDKRPGANLAGARSEA